MSSKVPKRPSSLRIQTSQKVMTTNMDSTALLSPFISPLHNPRLHQELTDVNLQGPLKSLTLEMGQISDDNINLEYLLDTSLGRNDNSNNKSTMTDLYDGQNPYEDFNACLRCQQISDCIMKGKNLEHQSLLQSEAFKLQQAQLKANIAILEEQIKTLQMENKSLSSELVNFKKIVSNKQLNSNDLLLGELKKRLSSKDFVIQQLQTQLGDRKKLFHRRKTSMGQMKFQDTTETSVANELDSLCDEVGEVRATFVKPISVHSAFRGARMCRP